MVRKVSRNMLIPPMLLLLFLAAIGSARPDGKPSSADNDVLFPLVQPNLFAISHDPRAPWAQLQVTLPLRHPAFSQFIAQVVDVSTAIDSSLRDVNRTFSPSPDNEHLIKITSLHPGHKYSVSVVGRQDDRSELVKEELVLMDPKAPDFSSASSSIDAQHTNITMKTLKAEKALQDSFQITYRQLEPEQKYPVLEVLDIQEQQELEVYLGNLHPGRDYTVSVIAVKDGVRSKPWSGMLTTKPLPVSSLVASDAAAGCVLLNWTMPDGGADGFEISYGSPGDERATGKVSLTASATATTLCDGIRAGDKLSLSVLTRKSSSTSDPVRVEHTVRPLAPMDFRIRPDISKGKYRLTADLPANSHYDQCQLLVVSEQLDKSDDTVSVEERRGKSSCTFFLPLVAGARYEFSLTTMSKGQRSQKLQRSIVLAPAFDMKAFGLTVQESSGSIQLAWPQNEVFMTRVKDLWNKVVGGDSLLQLRVSPLAGSGKWQKSRQVDTDPSRPQSITVPGVKAGGCYKVQMYTLTKSGIISEHRYNETMRISPPSVNVSLDTVTRTSGVLKYHLASPGELAECQLAVKVVDSQGMTVLDKRIPLTAQLPSFDLQGLRPFHKYTVNTQIVCGSSASSLAPAECGPSTRTMQQLSFSTRQDRPGPVQSLSFRALSPYSAQLSWLPPALPNGIVTGYTVEVRPMDPRFPPFTVSVPALSDREDHSVETVIENLLGGEKYTLDVRAVTEAGAGDAPSTDSPLLHTPIMAPPRPLSIPSVQMDTIGSRSLALRYSTNMFDPKHGRVVRSAVIVAEVTDDGRVSETWLYNENRTYTWSLVQRFDVWPAYTASVSDAPLVEQMSTSRSLTEVIGGDQTCADLPPDAVCNGPLKPGTAYKFKLRLYTAPNLWTDSEWSEIVSTEPLPVGFTVRALLLVLSTVAFIGVIAVIALALWNKGRKQSSCHAPPPYTKEGQWAALKMIMAERAADCLAKLGLDGTDQPNHMENNNGGLNPGNGYAHHRRCRSLRERTGVDHRLDRLPASPVIQKTPLFTVMAGTNPAKSRPVSIEDFPEHVRLMSADSDFRFSEEYEQLKSIGCGQSCHAAELPVNRAKNRFTNILPYDHSRVKLMMVDDEEGSDYVNANYMPGINSRREFIAAQGPLPSTRDAFWQMTWEQGCPAIIALTKCVEKGRDKCHQYWPDAEHMSVIYGDIEVTLMSELHSDELTIRELRLTRMSDPNQHRQLTHFHYQAWPDFGVPDHPHGIVRLARLFRAKLPHSPHNKPVVVHCSAGVGRSGTFMSIDRVMRVAELRRPLDVFGTCHEMRLERCQMVQNEQQYIFIHHCLLYCLTASEDDVPTDIHRNPAFEDDEGIAESGF